MLPTFDSKPAPSGGQLSWEQRLLKTSTQNRGALKPEYQELKFTLHRKLLDKINLEALATIDNQRVRTRSAPGGHLADRQRADAAAARSRSSRSATRCWTRFSAWGRSSRCCRTHDLRHSGERPPGRSTSSARVCSN